MKRQVGGQTVNATVDGSLAKGKELHSVDKREPFFFSYSKLDHNENKMVLQY